jgi:hypothetical protein
MYMTRKEIFLKCWFWSVITGVLVATIFWIVTDVGGFFHYAYGGAIFIDLLVGLSVVGSYVGAGYIGWRIVDKHYHKSVKYFIKRYEKYSLLSFIILIAVIYSPLSILGFLWSVLAPYCVIAALSKTKKTA